MKLSRKTIIPVIAFMSLSFMGCADFLETTPHDSLNSDNALESLDDFDNTANSVYEAMRSSYYTANFMLMVPDVMSDNLILNRDGRLIYNEFAGFKFYADTYGVSGMWGTAYGAILNANEVITRLESDPSIIATDEKRGKNLLAECLALRGMVHFDLVRLYGKNYLQASDSDLGVTYKKDTETTFPSRNTVKEVYTWLTEDLTRAKEMMSDDYNANINYRLNKKAVAAILARVYLTMGQNQLAVDNATEAITGDGSDIASIENFSKVYNTSMDVPEVLFRIALKSDDGYLPGNDWGQGSVSNYNANYSVSYGLMSLYSNTDCRKAVINQVTCNSGLCNVVWKWNNGGATTGLVDIPLIRTSEIYMTRAEANYNLRNYTEALNDLNLLRERRYSDYEAGTETGSALEQAILLQRRLELAFEGHRFFDLKRRHEDLVRDDKGFLADGTGASSDALEVSADSPYYVLPIPQAEIDANENMVQNEY